MSWIGHVMGPKLQDTPNCYRLKQKHDVYTQAPKIMDCVQAQPNNLTNKVVYELKRGKH